MLSTRFVRYSRVLKTEKWFNKLLNSNKYALSTQPAIKPTKEAYEKQLKDFESLTSVTKKIRQKKPQKPPFAKNLFLGVFDTDILTYPELEKEDVENLESAASLLEKLLKQEHMSTCNTFSNKNFRQNLSDYKAIGLQTSQLIDGRECNFSESSRFLEVLSYHELRNNIIYNEQLGVQILDRFASDKLKKKHLHQIMKGETLSAFCMSESGLHDIASVKTKAVLSEDGKTWVLNGEKSWVVNGKAADVLFVVALTDLIVRENIREPRLSIFLVDRDSPGISYTEVETDGVEMAHVSFNNTAVSSENVIGDVNKADKILTSVMTEFRLSSGPACISLTKEILTRLTHSILDQSNDKNMLHKTDAMRGKIGKLTTNLYAMESILYLTTGLIDTYENQDYELESTIVKAFSSHHCLNTSITALDLTGAPAIDKLHWANKLHREAVGYLSLYETNDSLKIMAALFGLQHAGFQLNDRVSKIRNPLFHSTFNLRRLWTNRRNMEDNPKLNLGLGDYLHPSCLPASMQIEYCVKRLEFATEILLIRCGSDIVNEHMCLRKLGECIMDIYAMIACIGRASRSYCIGLQYADYEMLLASAFCEIAKQRVKQNVLEIYGIEYITTNQFYREVGKQVFKSKGYCPKHPLSRNF